MPDNREELKVYRLEMAKERLHSSKILLEAGSYKDSIGRSYYAMFTAVRALLAVEGQDFSKHAGVIAYFQESLTRNIQNISVRHFKFETIPIMRIFFLCLCKMQRNSMIELKNL